MKHKNTDKFTQYLNESNDYKYKNIQKLIKRDLIKIKNLIENNKKEDAIKMIINLYRIID